MANQLYVVMYHYTRDLKNSRYPKLKGLDACNFEEQISFMANNYNVVTMEQVIGAWNGGEKLPKNALLLTFDDGYVDNYTVAFPILKKHRIQGSFFVPGKIINENVVLDVNKIHFILASANDDKQLMKELLFEIKKKRNEGYRIPSDEELISLYAIPNRFDTAETIFIKRILQTVLEEDVRRDISSRLFSKYVGIEEEIFAGELYVTKEQLGLMKSEGMFIGLHGYDHYWLGKLEEEKMRQDINKMIETMDDFIDKDRWVLNYPYGNYSDCVLEEIEKRGCVLGMTTECGIADVEKDSKFILPRMDCNDFPPQSDNYIKMSV